MKLRDERDGVNREWEEAAGEKNTVSVKHGLTGRNETE
jgi:hypothetical protein